MMGETIATKLHCNISKANFTVGKARILRRFSSSTKVTRILKFWNGEKGARAHKMVLLEKYRNIEQNR